jgi:hypothetical protein
MLERDIELGLVNSDAHDMGAIMLALKDHKYAGYLALGLSPTIGFIAEETYNYLTSRNILAEFPAFTGNYRRVIKKMRALLKLFDDTEGGREGVIAMLDLFQQKSILWMNKEKKGLYRAIIQTYLQPDIGIYFIDEDPFFMTTVGFSAAGKTRQEIEVLNEKNLESMSAYALAFSTAIGEYLGETYNLMNTLGIHTVTTPKVQNFSQIKVTHNDFRHLRLHSKLCRDLKITNKRLVAATLFILTQVNVAHAVFPSLLEKESNLLIRVRVLTAYHAVRALLELQGDIDPELISLVSSLDISQSVPNFKKVRNILAHYGMGEGKKFVSSGIDPLDEMIQGFSGMSKIEVSHLAGLYLKQISDWSRSRISKTELKSARALLGDHT